MLRKAKRIFLIFFGTVVLVGGAVTFGLHRYDAWTHRERTIDALALGGLALKCDRPMKRAAVAQEIAALEQSGRTFDQAADTVWEKIDGGCPPEMQRGTPG